METLTNFGRIKCSKVIEVNDKNCNALNALESTDLDSTNENDDPQFFENLRKKFGNCSSSSYTGHTESYNTLKSSSRKRLCVFDKDTQHIIKTFKQYMNDKDRMYKSNSKNPSRFTKTSSPELSFRIKEDTHRDDIASKEISTISDLDHKYISAHMDLTRQNSYSPTYHRITLSEICMEPYITDLDDWNSIGSSDVIDHGDVYITPPPKNYKLWE